jgi:hypothetical protein
VVVVLAGACGPLHAAKAIHHGLMAGDRPGVAAKDPAVHSNGNDHNGHYENDN